MARDIFFYVWIKDTNMSTLLSMMSTLANLTQAQSLILLVDFVQTDGKPNFISNPCNPITTVETEPLGAKNASVVLSRTSCLYPVVRVTFSSSSINVNRQQ
jgi:hypothetical protein